MKPCVNGKAAVCNSYITGQDTQCKLCCFTEVIPDLARPQNKQRWIDLEGAKRRLLVQLRELGLPPFQGELQQQYPLKFRFLEDQIDDAGNVTHFYTGHDEGVVTINVVEADSVEREQSRVNLREPLRTLIGHMRHEVGHYFDFALASRLFASEYVQIFGDPLGNDYEAAKTRYYDAGPALDWESAFVSPYASMHPWEDFAETSRCYLELMALLITAADQGDIDPQSLGTIQTIVERGLEIAVRVSEYSGDLGLPALLHEHFNEAVIAKLGFIHNLREAKDFPVYHPQHQMCDKLESRL